MSRRERGRFSNHTATETLQRQLTAPVHKWRKAWVAPSGLQAESSYKVCKWVRVNDKDVDDETNGVDGEDDDEEGENEEDEEDNDNNEGEDGDGETTKPTSTSTPAVVDTTPATPAAIPPSEAAAKGETAITENPEAASTETPAETTETEISAPKTDELMSVDPAEPTGTTESAPVQAESSMPETTAPAESTVPSAEPVPEAHQHTSIPSNAIEVTNTAPGHAEVGNADLGGEAGIEITRPTEPSAPTEPAEEETTKDVVEPPQAGSLGQQTDKMDIDEPEVEKGEAPEEDAGLVMGEMAPPVGQEGLAVTDQDQAKEAEAK